MLSIKLFPVFEGDFYRLADKVFSVGVVARESASDSIEEIKFTLEDVADIWFLRGGVHVRVFLVEVGWE